MEQDFSYSEEEIIEYILSNLEIDRQMFDLYLVPKWNIYSEVLLRLWLNYPENTQVQKIETVAVFWLTVTEAVVRSLLKKLNENAVYDLEIKDKLLPFHRDVSILLDFLRKNSQNFSEEVKKIYKSEKAAYETLLSELTKILRGTSSLMALENSFTTEDQKSLLAKLESLILKISQSEVIKTKIPDSSMPQEVRIAFSQQVNNELLNILRKKVELKSEKVLKNLIETGASSERVYFKRSMSELGRIFIKLQNDGKLDGIKGIAIAKWLASHFYFYNKDAKPQGYTEVTETRAKLVIYNKGLNSKEHLK